MTVTVEARVWFIWKNAQGRFSVATEQPADFIFKVDGPFTYKEAAVWMRARGQPGW